MNEFDESKHPRANDGKFTNGNGSYSDSVNERIRRARENGDEIPLNADGSVDDLTLQKMQEEARSAEKKTAKSQEEFFGEEFKGVKGAEAVEKLLKEKRGHIKNAFERSEIGGIDLVWGDKNGGLYHTILKRDKLLEKGKGNVTGLEMARKIPEIVKNGKFNQDDDGRLNIDYDGYRVGLTPKYFDKKVNWIVTAMEKWE